MPPFPDSAVREHDTETDTAESPAPSRRRFFALGASAVAAVAAGTALDAQTGLTRGKPITKKPPVGAKPDPSVDFKDPLLRLVRRITMGLEPTEVARARQLGYYGYLEYHLNAPAIDDSVVDGLIAARMPLLAQSSATLRTADGGEVYNQLADAALLRAAVSRRQLKERMVEFWTDHFNILYEKVGYLKAADDRDVIRQFALGRFPDMVRASANSAAMLLYLDQNSSRTPTPNQNYARELLELHTLGVDNFYTQNDVAQLSRILTGWTFNSNGVFVFQTSMHDKTAKTFMELNIPAIPGSTTAAALAQRGEGDQAITYLVNHPGTAKFIATKMARWLLAYDPPTAVIDATAAKYLATGGDIKSMIRVILSPANLLAAPAKYKRPFHLAASSLRGMAVEITNIRSTRQRLDVLDMPPFYWEQPDGFPDRVNWWSGLVVQRWNWANYIATQNSGTNVRVNSVANFRTPQDNADGVVNQINVRMFGNEMPASLRTSLLTYLRGGTYNDTRVRETLALAASSQQFQWY